MENVQFFVETFIHYAGCKCDFIYFGLKEINTAQKTYILISWKSIGIYWKLLNPAN